VRASDIFLDGTDGFEFSGPMHIDRVHILDADTTVTLGGEGRAGVVVEDGASAEVQVGGNNQQGITNTPDVTFYGFHDGTTTIELLGIPSDWHAIHWHADTGGGGTLAIREDANTIEHLIFADSDITFGNLSFGGSGNMVITYQAGGGADGLLDGIG
jgi:hypothetical protein